MKKIALFFVICMFVLCGCSNSTSESEVVLIGYDEAKIIEDMKKKKLSLIIIVILIILGIIYIVNKNNDNDTEIERNEINNTIEFQYDNQQSFVLKYNQRKDLGIKEIYDTGNYKIKTFGGDVTITVNNIEYSFIDALNQKIITGEDIVEQAEKDSEKSICEKNIYLDGGSIEYRYSEYTVLKMNRNRLKFIDSDEYTGEDNHDLIIGMKGEILNRYENK